MVEHRHSGSGGGDVAEENNLFSGRRDQHPRPRHRARKRGERSGVASDGNDAGVWVGERPHRRLGRRGELLQRGIQPRRQSHHHQIQPRRKPNRLRRRQRNDQRLELRALVLQMLL